MLFKNKLVLLNIVILPLILFYSCTSTQNNPSPEDIAQASVPDNPNDDPSYAPILKKWQRDVNLYKNFELYFSGSVVLMTPEMTQAYKKQVEKVQGPIEKFDENIVPQEKDMISVVIAAYTTSSKFIEIDNHKIWNLTLFYHNKWIQPASLVYYRNKSSFVPYFNMGPYWSRMYVVKFHIPQFDQEYNERGDHTFAFSMGSGIAKADYFWR